MPQILLTDYCNRRCPYCFAKEHLSDREHTNMRYEDFVRVVDFLVDSGEQEARLLGGEPTLHPDFADFYHYVMQRGLHAMIFTNGCAPEATVDDLCTRIAPERTHFVVNVNAPEDRQDGEDEKQGYFFSHLAEVAGVGLNMYRPDLDPMFLFDVIEQYGLRPDIRVGIAHPIVGTGNMHLATSDFRRVHQRLADLARICDERGAKLTLDCGFTLCNFTDEELGVFVRSQVELNTACGPIVDIGPNLDVWPCFPLSSLKPARLEDFDSVRQLKEFFYREVSTAVVQERGHTGIFTECAACRYRERGNCTGGCLAHAFTDEPPVSRPAF